MNTPTTNYTAGALAEADNSASCLIARAVESQALRRDWKDLVNDNIATFEKALAHVSDAASQKHVLTLQLNDITAGASHLVASRAEQDNTVSTLIASVKAAQAQRIAANEGVFNDTIAKLEKFTKAAEADCDTYGRLHNRAIAGIEICAELLAVFRFLRAILLEAEQRKRVAAEAKVADLEAMIALLTTSRFEDLQIEHNELKTRNIELDMQQNELRLGNIDLKTEQNKLETENNKLRLDNDLLQSQMKGLKDAMSTFNAKIKDLDQK